MLRPERMSRVSVTGSKQVMEPVIETVHDLNLVHVSDYDGAWEGFDPGNPIGGADEAAEKLVTVRALQSTLGIEEGDAGPTRLVTDEALEEELEEVREEVNELDDRRSDLEDDLRSVEERIDTVEPFAKLGIDLDLLSGYDSLSVAVGEGDADEIERALDAAGEVSAHEVFSEDDAVAVFVYPEEVDVNDLLVGVRFQSYEVPDAEGSPEEYVSELRHRKQRLESELDTVESELQNLRLDVAGFLLAAEEKLAIEVQKTEAPLSFATTENAFVAEGWVPTDRYPELATSLESAVGDRIEVEELERADYDADGHATHREEVGREAPGEPTPTASAGESQVPAEAAGEQEREEYETADEGERSPPEPRSDGGAVTMGDDEPPVIQDNPAGVKPFEALVEVINRPKYTEFDPTVVLFLTFPAFFGFMIGDVGYGILYVALGYWLYSSFDSDIIRSLGGIGMWAGGFTILFGVLYGEFFGLHELGEIVWGGNPPMHKGLQPAEVAYAQAWLILSLLLGVLHLIVGYGFDFVENLSHGVKDAVTESGSWILLMVGAWVWIFSRHAAESKPAFIYKVFGTPEASLGFLSGEAAEVGEEAVAYSLGFTGFPVEVGLAGLAVAALGLVLLIVGEGGIGLLESLNVLVNVLSYTRIAAVLLAKAGMAFVVNLLFFGAYTHHGEFHFLTDHGPGWVATEYGGEATVMFPGMIHSGIAGVLGGIVVLVVGHLLVLALGITSAGLQAVRLEYVEFFGKFYEGGGRAFDPFGYERQYTTEE